LPTDPAGCGIASKWPQYRITFLAPAGLASGKLSILSSLLAISHASHPRPIAPALVCMPAAGPCRLFSCLPGNNSAKKQQSPGAWQKPCAGQQRFYSHDSIYHFAMCLSCSQIRNVCMRRMRAAAMRHEFKTISRTMRAVVGVSVPAGELRDQLNM